MCVVCCGVLLLLLLLFVLLYLIVASQSVCDCVLCGCVWTAAPLVDDRVDMLGCIGRFTRSQVSLVAIFYEYKKPVEYRYSHSLKCALPSSDVW